MAIELRYRNAIAHGNEYTVDHVDVKTLLQKARQPQGCVGSGGHKKGSFRKARGEKGSGTALRRRSHWRQRAAGETVALHRQGGSWFWYRGGLAVPGCPEWGVRWLLYEPLS